MKEVDRLLFGTAGTPLSAKRRDTVSGIQRVKELGLDMMELEYVRGTFPGEAKALEIATAQIVKRFGKGAIMKLGEGVKQDVDVIPTGALSLDIALGVGGVFLVVKRGKNILIGSLI